MLCFLFMTSNGFLDFWCRWPEAQLHLDDDRVPDGRRASPRPEEEDAAGASVARRRHGREHQRRQTVPVESRWARRDERSTDWPADVAACEFGDG